MAGVVSSGLSAKTGRPRPSPAVSEADFLRQILDVAKLLGWRVAHFRPALTARGWRTPVQADGKGFPDLLMIRGGRILAVELKGPTGRLTPEQEAWLAAFDRNASVEAYVWRPGDLASATVVLRGESGAEVRP